MKQFTSMQEWAKSKPSDQETARVLEFINKNAKHEMKRDVNRKKYELKKLNRLISDMNSVGLKPSKEMDDMYTEKIRVVELLTLEIGEPEKKAKPAKKVNIEDTPSTPAN
jgi:hypothetical protein